MVRRVPLEFAGTFKRPLIRVSTNIAVRDDPRGIRAKNVVKQLSRELERRHNAHRNATENIVHFVFLAMLVSVISPVTIAAQVWMVGFAIGRLGHTFSYLTGRDGARGLFMSVSLLSLYGLASYLVISLIV